MESDKINKFIEHFTDIYDENGKEINPLPKNDRFTAYYNGNMKNKVGFHENTTIEEMGIDVLIAKRWIRQTELDLRVKIAALEEEVEVDNKLIEGREGVLALIPECPVHGAICLPHCRGWIENKLEESSIKYVEVEIAMDECIEARLNINNQYIGDVFQWLENNNYKLVKTK